MLCKMVCMIGSVVVYLKYQLLTNSPYSQVADEWIADIFPDSRLMKGSLTRFLNLINAARSSFMTLQPNLREDFLNKEIDLNFISQACSSVGITRMNYSTPLGKTFDPPVKILNGLVLTCYFLAIPSP